MSNNIFNFFRSSFVQTNLLNSFNSLINSIKWKFDDEKISEVEEFGSKFGNDFKDSLINIYSNKLKSADAKELALSKSSGKLNISREEFFKLFDTITDENIKQFISFIFASPKLIYEKYSKEYEQDNLFGNELFDTYLKIKVETDDLRDVLFDKFSIADCFLNPNVNSNILTTFDVEKISNADLFWSTIELNMEYGKVTGNNNQITSFARAIEIMKMIAPVWNQLRVSSEFGSESDNISNVTVSIQPNLDQVISVYRGNYNDVPNDYPQANEIAYNLISNYANFNKLSNSRKLQISNYLINNRSVFNNALAQSAKIISDLIESECENPDLIDFRNNKIAIKAFNKIRNSYSSIKSYNLKTKINFIVSFYLPIINNYHSKLMNSKTRFTKVNSEILNIDSCSDKSSKIHDNSEDFQDTIEPVQKKSPIYYPKLVSTPKLDSRIDMYGGVNELINLKVEQMTEDELVNELGNAQKEFNKKYEELYREMVRNLGNITLPSIYKEQVSNLYPYCKLFDDIAIKDPKTSYRISGYYAKNSVNSGYRKLINDTIFRLKISKISSFVPVINTLEKMEKLLIESASNAKSIRMKFLKSPRNSVGLMARATLAVKIPCELKQKDFILYDEAIKRLYWQIRNNSSESTFFNNKDEIKKYIELSKDRSAFLKKQFEMEKMDFQYELLEKKVRNPNQYREIKFGIMDEIQNGLIYINEVLEPQLVKLKENYNRMMTTDQLRKIENSYMMFKSSRIGEDFQNQIKELDKSLRKNADVFTIADQIKKILSTSGYIQFIEMIYKELNIFPSNFNWEEFNSKLLNLIVFSNLSVNISNLNGFVTFPCYDYKKCQFTDKKIDLWVYETLIDFLTSLVKKSNPSFNFNNSNLKVKLALNKNYLEYINIEYLKESSENEIVFDLGLKDCGIPIQIHDQIASDERNVTKKLEYIKGALESLKTRLSEDTINENISTSKPLKTKKINFANSLVERTGDFDNELNGGNNEKLIHQINDSIDYLKIALSNLNVSNINSFLDIEISIIRSFNKIIDNEYIDNESLNQVLYNLSEIYNTISSKYLQLTSQRGGATKKYLIQLINPNENQIIYTTFKNNGSKWNLIVQSSFESLISEVLRIIDNYWSMKYQGNLDIPIGLNNLLQGGSIFDNTAFHDISDAKIIPEAVPLYIIGLNIISFYIGQLKTYNPNSNNSLISDLRISKLSPLWEIYKMITSYNMNLSNISISQLTTIVGIFNDIWQQMEGSNIEKLSSGIDYILNELNSSLIVSSSMERSLMDFGISKDKFSTINPEQTLEIIRNIYQSSLMTNESKDIDQQNMHFEKILHQSLVKIRELPENQRMLELRNMISSSTDIRSSNLDNYYKLMELVIIPLIICYNSYEQISIVFKIIIRSYTGFGDIIEQANKFDLRDIQISDSETFWDIITKKGNDLIQFCKNNADVVKKYNTYVINDIILNYLRTNKWEKIQEFWNPDKLNTYPKKPKFEFKSMINNKEAFNVIDSAKYQNLLRLIFPEVKSRNLSDYYDIYKTRFKSDVDACIHLMMSFPYFNDNIINNIRSNLHDQLASLEDVIELNNISNIQLKFDFKPPELNDHALNSYMLNSLDGKMISDKIVESYDYDESKIHAKWIYWVIENIANLNYDFIIPFKLLDLFKQNSLFNKYLQFKFKYIKNNNQELFIDDSLTVDGKRIPIIIQQCIARSSSEKNKAISEFSVYGENYINNIITIIPYLISVLIAAEEFDTNNREEIIELIHILTYYYNDILIQAHPIKFLQSGPYNENHLIGEIKYYIDNNATVQNLKDKISVLDWANKYKFEYLNMIAFPEFKNFDRFEWIDKFAEDIFKFSVFKDNFEIIKSNMGIHFWNIIIINSIADSSNIDFKITVDKEYIKDSILNLIVERMKGGDNNELIEIIPSFNDLEENNKNIILGMESLFDSNDLIDDLLIENDVYESIRILTSLLIKNGDDIVKNDDETRLHENQCKMLMKIKNFNIKKIIQIVNSDDEEFTENEKNFMKILIEYYVALIHKDETLIEELSSRDIVFELTTDQINFIINKLNKISDLDYKFKNVISVQQIERSSFKDFQNFLLILFNSIKYNSDNDSYLISSNSENDYNLREALINLLSDDGFRKIAQNKYINKFDKFSDLVSKIKLKINKAYYPQFGYLLNDVDRINKILSETISYLYEKRFDLIEIFNHSLNNLQKTLNKFSIKNCVKCNQILNNLGENNPSNNSEVMNQINNLKKNNNDDDFKLEDANLKLLDLANYYLSNLGQYPNLNTELNLFNNKSLNEIESIYLRTLNQIFEKFNFEVKIHGQEFKAENLEEFLKSNKFNQINEIYSFFSKQQKLNNSDDLNLIFDFCIKFNSINITKEDLQTINDTIVRIFNIEVENLLDNKFKNIKGSQTEYRNFIIDLKNNLIRLFSNQDDIVKELPEEYKNDNNQIIQLINYFINYSKFNNNNIPNAIFYLLQTYNSNFIEILLEIKDNYFNSINEITYNAFKNYTNTNSIEIYKNRYSFEMPIIKNNYSYTSEIEEFQQLKTSISIFSASDKLNLSDLFESIEDKFNSKFDKSNKNPNKINLLAFLYEILIYLNYRVSKSNKGGFKDLFTGINFFQCFHNKPLEALVSNILKLNSSNIKELGTFNNLLMKHISDDKLLFSLHEKMNLDDFLNSIQNINLLSIFDDNSFMNYNLLNHHEVNQNSLKIDSKIIQKRFFINSQAAIRIQEYKGIQIYNKSFFGNDLSVSDESGYESSDTDSNDTEPSEDIPLDIIDPDFDKSNDCLISKLDTYSDFEISKNLIETIKRLIQSDYQSLNSLKKEKNSSGFILTNLNGGTEDIELPVALNDLSLNPIDRLHNIYANSEFLETFKNSLDICSNTLNKPSSIFKFAMDYFHKKNIKFGGVMNSLIYGNILTNSVAFDNFVNKISYLIKSNEDSLFKINDESQQILPIVISYLLQFNQIYDSQELLKSLNDDIYGNYEFRIDATNDFLKTINVNFDYEMIYRYCDENNKKDELINRPFALDVLTGSTLFRDFYKIGLLATYLQMIIILVHQTSYYDSETQSDIPYSRFSVDRLNPFTRT